MAAQEKEEKNKKAQEMPKCPVCNQNDEVIPVVYGYPGYEMMVKAEKGEIKLGGCMVGEQKFFCKRDEESF